tara:strand:- start:141 stop:389 length:249 start_codon:yes stop_codon:yes gene_type:complete
MNYNGQRSRTRIRGERSNPVISRGIVEMDSIEEILYKAYNNNKFNEVRDRAMDIILENNNRVISRIEAYTMAYNEIIEDNKE